MKIILYFFALVILLQTANCYEKPVSYAFDANASAADLPIDIIHVGSDVSFVPEKCMVIAKVEFEFLAKRDQIDSISFYTPDFQFKSITLNGLLANYKISGSNTVIYPSKKLSATELSRIVFDYTCTPKDGAIYFVGWDDPTGIKRKQIWAHRPHGWIPFYDDRVTVDMHITFDEQYKVFSNGDRIEVKKNSDGTQTWHYRLPKNHPFFSTALVIGNYDYKVSKTKAGTPLELWYYPEYSDRVETTYRYTEQMFDFLEKEIGVAYPYSLYREAPVIDYMYGAMETTTSTVFGDFFQVDSRAFYGRNYINVNVHELAHQWFGNCIIHLTPADVWLTESFATYFAKIFEHSIYGDDFYQHEKYKEFQTAMELSKVNSNPLASSMSGSQRVYQKGSLVMGMLRYVLGDEDFRKSIKLYMERYSFGYAETSDFRRAIWDATGKDLSWFFDEWIKRGGEPKYNISWKEFDSPDAKRNTVIKVNQIHEINELTGLFKMPINFEVHYADGSIDKKTEWIQNKETLVSIENSGKKKVEFVLFDPGREIMKNFTFARTFEELAATALKAENMIDRYDALADLKSTPLDKKRELLVKIFNNEKYHFVKSEVVAQLAGDSLSYPLLAKAASDPSPFVRRSLLDNMKMIPEELRPSFESMLTDSSYINLEYALNSLCSSFPEKVQQYLESTKNETGWRGRNIRIKWLEIAVDNGSKDYLKGLIDFSTPSFEFETRVNSLQSLRRLNILDSTICESLFNSATHWNTKLRATGTEILQYFSKQDAYKRLIVATLANSAIDPAYKSRIKAILAQ